MQIPSYEEEVENLTWNGGPTHHLQKQHIPGYCGHVKGLKAENLHGHPFSKLTADSLQERLPKGFIIEDDERFKTTAQLAFTHPRGEEPSNTLKNAAVSILTNTNSHMMDCKKRVKPDRPKDEDPEIPPIDRIPVSGYQGYRPVYRNPVKKFRDPVPEEFQTTKYADTQISQVLDHTEQRLELNRPVPCVGYTGFVIGQKAKNAHGRSYHNIVLESKLRQTLSNQK